MQTSFPLWCNKGYQRERGKLDLSWSLKYDEHGDISKPSGKIQEIDIDLMSSHATMKKKTHNPTQNAVRHPSHIHSGTGPGTTPDEAYQPLSLTRLHKAAAISQRNILAVTFWASASHLIRTDLVRTDHLSHGPYYNYTDRILTFSTKANAGQCYCCS